MGGGGGNITSIVMTRTILQIINLVGKMRCCGDHMTDVLMATR